MSLREHPPQELTANTPFFIRGWIVVGAAFVCMFLTGPGQTLSYAMFVNSIISDTGWSRSLVSSLYSVATTVSGGLMFLVGRLVDRYGSRRINTIAIVLLALSCLFASFVANPAMLFFAFFLGRFSGQGMLSISSGTVAPQWFVRRRALAMAIVGLGATIAFVILPRLNYWLISSVGWRRAFQFLGAGVAGVGIPVVLLLLWSRPEDRGLLPDGGRLKSTTPVGGSSEERSLNQREAVRTPALWFLVYAFFQTSMVATGVTFHFVSILNGVGFSDSFAATVLTVSPVAGVVSTLIVGLLMDRLRRPQLVLAFSCLGQMASRIMLAFLQDETVALLYSILNGFSVAASMLSIQVLIPHLFGRRYIGGISGILQVSSVIGSAIGPLYFAAAFEATGGYRGVLLVSSLFPAIAAFLAILIRRPAIAPETE